MTPTDLVEEQWGTIQLLQSMFPLPYELVLSPETLMAIEQLDSDPTNPISLSSFDLTLRVLINDDDTLPIEFSASLLLNSDLVEHGQGQKIKVSVRQPAFLTRATFEEMISTIPKSDHDSPSSEVILATIDHIHNFSIPSAHDSEVKRPSKASNETEKLERVWFWFPSLSTREKRKDLVEYAGLYSLTGFVMAGKPGLLCVEGDGQRIDRYMAAIKSESWGDIPSHQKKVTERLRRPLSSPLDRKFPDMKEITHLVPQHGQYNHRGDMGEVKRLMDQWGVGDDFGAVVMNSGT